MQISFKTLPGNNLIIISQPGEEISEFLPILVASNSTYILVISDRYANASALGERFSYVCNHFKGVKKCFLKSLQRKDMLKTHHTIYTLCRNYSINHIFTFSTYETSFMRREISRIADKTLSLFAEDKTYSKQGRLLDIDSYINTAITTNLTHHWPYSQRPHLYTLLNNVDFDFFTNFIRKNQFNTLYAVSPFIKLDKKIVRGLKSFKFFNAYERILYSNYHLSNKKIKEIPFFFTNPIEF